MLMYKKKQCPYICAARATLWSRISVGPEAGQYETRYNILYSKRSRTLRLI